MNHNTQMAFCNELEKITKTAYGMGLGERMLLGGALGGGIGGLMSGLSGPVESPTGQERLRSAIGGGLGGAAGGALGAMVPGMASPWASSLGGIAGSMTGEILAQTPETKERMRAAAEREREQEMLNQKAMESAKTAELNGQEEETSYRGLGKSLGSLAGLYGGYQLSKRIVSPRVARSIAAVARRRGGLNIPAALGATALGVMVPMAAGQVLGGMAGGQIGKRYDPDPEKEAGVGAVLGGIGKALSSVGRLGKAAIKGKIKAPTSLSGAKGLAKSTGKHLKTQFARGAASPSVKNVALGAGATAGLGGFAAGRLSKRREPTY